MILILPYEISPGIKNLYQIGGQLSITLYIHFITWDFLTHPLPLAKPEERSNLDTSLLTIFQVC